MFERSPVICSWSQLAESCPQCELVHVGARIGAYRKFTCETLKWVSIHDVANEVLKRYQRKHYGLEDPKTWGMKYGRLRAIDFLRKFSREGKGGQI